MRRERFRNNKWLSISEQAAYKKSAGKFLGYKVRCMISDFCRGVSRIFALL
jgi:hypothetical protein